MPTTINGLLVAKRCSVLEDDDLKALIWFIQSESLQPAGLKKLIAETNFRNGDGIQEADLIKKEAVVLEFCLKPTTVTKAAREMIPSLCQIRAEKIAKALVSAASTEVSAAMHQALEFCLSRRRMIRIEGVPGIGKTVALRSWVNAQRGLARYVEVPSSDDDRSFYVAVASALGIAKGNSYNGQQIKLRVEETLKISRLMLVFDESHLMWREVIRPRGTPSRIQWIKTLFDTGVPMALISTPDFTKWQKHYVEKTTWSDEQLERRINRKVSLVSELSKSDLLLIARNLHPAGDERSWLLLAGYARACVKKNASAIEEAMESAIDLVEKAGRQRVTFTDIEEALERFHFPGDGLPSLRKPKSLNRSPFTISGIGLSDGKKPQELPETIFRRAPAALPRGQREASAESIM